MRIYNKVILITGGYTGIGRAIAGRCVAEGAKVVVNGMDDELGQVLADELGQANVRTLTIDITRSSAPDFLVKGAVSAFGRLDAVVNNAAMIVNSDIHTSTDALLHQMFAVNTLAPLSIIQAALPYLSAANGCVLNIGSVNAWGGEPDLLGYSMSKGALMTMSRNLGDNLFRQLGIRVNQINPGWVLTEKEKELKHNEGMKEDWYRQLPAVFAPAKRLFTPEEIASACIFLLSDECGPMSGQVVEMEQFPMPGRNLPKSWSGSHR